MAFHDIKYDRPFLPLTAPIAGGLKDGLKVLVNGSVLSSCERFQIDFQCGRLQSPRPDVAFHFNPRFDEGCVVSNSFERGAWQREERKQDLPFRKGFPFEIQILVNSSSFVVAVDGKHYLEFRHRISLNRVDTVYLSGGLEVISFIFKRPLIKPDLPTYPVFPPSPVFPPNPVFPPGYPPNLACPSEPYFCSQGFPVPFRTPISGGLSPSKSIILSGKVPPYAIRFHVNLKAGSNIAFQLNPRFDENVIVRNSKLKDGWGTEERHLPTGMPLSRGKAFSMWIFCEAQRFRVTMSGKHQLEYNYRFPNLKEINQLEVEGDVILTKVDA